MICPGKLRPFLGRWPADLVCDVLRIDHDWGLSYVDSDSEIVERTCATCGDRQHAIGDRPWRDGPLPGSDRKVRP